MHIVFIQTAGLSSDKDQALTWTTKFMNLIHSDLFSIEAVSYEQGNWGTGNYWILPSTWVVAN